MMNFHRLEIDLTNKTSRTVDEEAAMRLFTGGRGFGAKLLWDYTGKDTDPLGPENPLHFGLGPLTGLLGAVTNVSALSPLTGLRGQSNMNGHFGQEMLLAGYGAGITLTGVSDELIYVLIENDRVRIKSAEKLRGKSGLEAQVAVQRDEGHGVARGNLRVAAIGVAGENLVANADICHDVYHHAARLGMGAVMGSKRVKAIAVRGTQAPSYENPDAIWDFLRWLYGVLPLYQAKHRRWGHTISMAERYSKLREGVKNKQLGWHESCDRFNPILFEQSYKIWSDACQGCFVGCKVPYHRGGGRFAPCAGELRHDNAGGWSANALVGGYEEQMYLSAYVDHLGLDGEDVSGIVAWLMECFERGIVSKEELGGIDLTWGNVPAICELLDGIARREGIGELLAHGLKEAARKLGRGSGQYAMTGKGLAITSYEPRGSLKEATELAATAVGELHGGRGSPDRILFDSLTFCSFLRKPLLKLHGSTSAWAAPLVNAATGWDITEMELNQSARRSLVVERLVSMRRGYSPTRDDKLPDRFFEEQISGKYGDTATLDRDEFSEALSALYLSYGLGPDGVPTGESLRELGLEGAFGMLG